MTLSRIICFFVSLTPTLSLAFFCPTNFNQIDFGYSTDQVSQLCGKPDKQETKEEKDNVPQEWTYFISQPVSTGGMTQTQGTLKAQIMFDANGKAINISVNGIGVGESTICGGTSIQLGSTQDQIKAACGDPSLVTKQDPTATPGAKAGESKITEFTYMTNPPVTLVFENGVLTSKK